MRTVHVKPMHKIPIGRLGENETTRIIFDVSNYDVFGEGVFTLLHQRPSDLAPYPCVIEQDGKQVVWEIKSADVAVAGYGRCELVYTIGNAIAKSDIYTTVTGVALTGEEEPPEPWEDWVTRVLEVGLEVEEFLALTGVGTAGQVWTKTDTGATWADPQGGGGGGSWSTLDGKPFSTIGSNLKVENGALTVDTADQVQEDNTKPITSAAVFVEVGNINALLELI